MSDNPGRRPELKWLPIEKLSVDAAYQRTLDSRRSQQVIERIAENFRWSAFQAVLAVRHDDGWRILDGQHRVEAARRRKIAEVPAVVVTAASVAEQASAFVSANLDRVAVNPYALYHARLVAGDDTAMVVARVCEAAKLKIPRSGTQADNLRAGETLALGSILAIVKSHGEVSASLVCATAARAFGATPGGVRAALVRALARILGATPADERADLFGRIEAWLKTQTADDLRIKALKRKATYGGTEIINLEQLIRRGLSAATAPSDGVGTIKAPSRERLMAGR